ncbi:hypothetical protein EV207_15623 [Scopulibacillus darangshiensis]|uniref:Uncharacterized protein n=1 Tax=Scopulibacillus darangshiensis TaxID=442528 RepID=A0A4R2NFF0_9BACL|nr:hypothetical protein EV207_15623 [Scopulibacillus darangshiensis]
MIFALVVLSFICCILLFAFTRKPILALLHYNDRVKTVRIIFGSEVIISAIGFYLIYITTVPPTGGSGNGNPMLIYFAPISLA